MADACPHADCTIHVATGMFACRRHWFKLSRELRSRVQASYRTAGDADAWSRAEAEREWAALRGIDHAARTRNNWGGS